MIEKLGFFFSLIWIWLILLIFWKKLPSFQYHKIGGEKTLVDRENKNLSNHGG
jgi:hypothetical protein